MKPFNLKAALAGASVITATGQPVRILCTDLNKPDHNIVVAVTTYGYEAIHLCNESTEDYFMAPTWEDSLKDAPVLCWVEEGILSPRNAVLITGTTKDGYVCVNGQLHTLAYPVEPEDCYQG